MARSRPSRADARDYGAGNEGLGKHDVVTHVSKERLQEAPMGAVVTLLAVTILLSTTSVLVAQQGPVSDFKLDNPYEDFLRDIQGPNYKQPEGVVEEKQITTPEEPSATPPTSGLIFKLRPR